jgi:ABC-type Fe3+ transport system substrate-binding protein
MEWGEEKTANWIRSLINNGKIMISNAPREGILRSGERPVSITDFASGSQRLAKRGAPFKY